MSNPTHCRRGSAGRGVRGHVEHTAAEASDINTPPGALQGREGGKGEDHIQCVEEGEWQEGGERVCVWHRSRGVQHQHTAKGTAGEGEQERKGGGRGHGATCHEGTPSIHSLSHTIPPPGTCQPSGGTKRAVSGALEWIAQGLMCHNAKPPSAARPLTFPHPKISPAIQNAPLQQLVAQQEAPLS